MKQAIMILCSVMALSTIGCGSAGNPDLGEFEEIEGKTDSVLPEIGTYLNHAEQVRVGELHSLLLKSDKTFVASMKKRCVDPVGWKCLPVELTGSYKFTRSPGNRRFIRLMDDGNTLLARFEYVAGAEGLLSLKNTESKDAEWFDLNLTSERGCTIDSDCAEGAEWCEAGRCVPCSNGGRFCALYCEHGFVDPRNGCFPCKCKVDGPPCEELADSQCGPFNTDDAELVCLPGMRPIVANCPGGEACCVPEEPVNTCESDSDCEFGEEWCVDGTCSACDNGGRFCKMYCADGMVDPRNGCQPCRCKEDIFACASDDECVVAKADCCGCQMGGTSVAVNRDHADEVGPDPESCQHIACKAVYTCRGNPACVDGQCMIVEGRPNPYACEIDDDCVMVKADCCGCQMGGKSVAVNRNFADGFGPDPESCQHMYCKAVYNCFGGPACVDGMCTTLPRG